MVLPDRKVRYPGLWTDWSLSRKVSRFLDFMSASLCYLVLFMQAVFLRFSLVCRVLHPYSSEFVCHSSSHMQRRNGCLFLNLNWKFQRKRSKEGEFDWPSLWQLPITVPNQRLPLKWSRTNMTAGLISREDSGLSKATVGILWHGRGWGDQGGERARVAALRTSQPN